MHETATSTQPITAPAPAETTTTPSPWRVDGQVSWKGALTAALAWIASIAVIDAVAPAADPDAVLSGFELFMTMAYTSALLVGAVGLALRQRLGVMASVAGGGLFLIGSVSCWMGGHVGSWIAVQAVLGGAMMLLGTAVLRRS